MLFLNQTLLLISHIILQKKNTFSYFFQIEKLEGDLKIALESGGGPGSAFQTMPLPDSIAVTSAEVIANLNEHLVVVLQVGDVNNLSLIL